MKKKFTAALSLLLTGVVGFSALGIAKAVSADKEPREFEAVISNFEDSRELMCMADFYSEVEPIGYFALTKEGNENAINGKSLEIYAEGVIGSKFYSYNKDQGVPLTVAYNLSTNLKNSGAWGFDWKYLDEYSFIVNNPNDFEVRVSAFMTAVTNGIPVTYGTEVVPAFSQKKVTVNVSRYQMQQEYAGWAIKEMVLGFDWDKKVLTEEDCAARKYDLSEPGTLTYPAATFYVDDIKAKINETPVRNENGKLNIPKKFASATEILNFDDPSDIEYMTEFGGNFVKEADNNWITYHWSMGTGSGIYHNVNKNFVQEGNIGSLEWRVNPTLQEKFMGTNYQYCTDNNYLYALMYTGITVCPAYLDFYNFSQIQKGGVTIKVDVYNAFPYDKEVAFGMHDMSGIATELKTEWPYSHNAFAPTDVWTKLPAGEWTTLEISDFSKLDLSKGLARLRLTTSVMDVYSQGSFYVNNLRIEYAE